MEANLKLSSEEMDDEDLQAITLELVKSLNTETDIEASLIEKPGEAGSKGDLSMIGQILLTALTSGTVVAMFEVLKTYFQRKPLLEVDVTLPDGRHLKLKGEQIGKDQIDQTLNLATAFIEGKDE